MKIYKVFKTIIIIIFVSLLFQYSAVIINAETRSFVENYIEDSIGHINLNKSAAAYGVLYCGNAVLMYGKDKHIDYYIRDRETYPYRSSAANTEKFERRLDMMKVRYDKYTVGGLLVINITDSCNATLAFDNVTGTLMYASVSK